MTRLKGMHGVCLCPAGGSGTQSSRLQPHRIRADVPLVANVATRVHEAYQSFFPPDVHHVADHARRSTSSFPLACAYYYGVNYGERGRSGIPAAEMPSQYAPPHCRQDPGAVPVNYPPNDLSFYANIPTPCSYMAMGSRDGFFGGYDHRARAGIIHVANPHISPGKKQWTWGNHDFGYAWDRNLTDATADGEHPPYIEIMAGVYTDNQPDFSFLHPGETKTWSHYWYPIQEMGPAQHANVDAAVKLALGKARFQVSVCVTRSFPNAVIRLERANGSGAAEWDSDLAPGKPFLLDSPQAAKPGSSAKRCSACWTVTGEK
jgi:hypothetical protein